jgi:hypothetical protein
MNSLSPSFIYFMSFGISSLVLYFVMMIILSRDKKTDNITISPIGVISDFWSLMKNEQNLKLKRKYKIILGIQILLIPAYIVGGFFI